MACGSWLSRLLLERNDADYFGVAAVTMHRRAPCNPLTQDVVSEDSVCCMVPLLSGRKYVRVGCGPMDSAFYTSSHNEVNKQILHPAFIKLKIAQRMKGCATRVLRASTMCHLWHNEGGLCAKQMCKAPVLCFHSLLSLPLRMQCRRPTPRSCQSTTTTTP